MSINGVEDVKITIMNELIEWSSGSTIWCAHLIIGHNKGVICKMMLFDVDAIQVEKAWEREGNGSWKRSSLKTKSGQTVVSKVKWNAKSKTEERICWLKLEEIKDKGVKGGWRRSTDGQIRATVWKTRPKTQTVKSRVGKNRQEWW